jgi:hypothetical protein
MKRMPLILAMLGVLVFVTLFRFSNIFQKPLAKTSVPLAATQERAEDPAARAHQEWMQLRDPKTNQVPTNIRARELSYAKLLPNAESIVGHGLLKGEVLSWTSRGPYNQGGRTRALAYDLSDGTWNTILAGGVSGGMWRSTNGGTSWTRTSSLADSVQSVSCLAQDPRAASQSTWYYGTGEYLGNSARGGGDDAFYLGDGIYKSTNSGVSWQKLTVTASWTPQVFDKTADFVWDIVVDPTNGNVYAAIYGQIIRSTNSGTTWTSSLNSTTTNIFSTFTDIAVTSTGVFYAVLSSDGETAGVYRSTTGASGSWVNITPAGWPTTYDRTVLAIAPSNQNCIYFLSETQGYGFHNTSTNEYTSFWKYTDNGSGTGTWVDRSANLPYVPPGPNGDVESQTQQSGLRLHWRNKPLQVKRRIRHDGELSVDWWLFDRE